MPPKSANRPGPISSNTAPLRRQGDAAIVVCAVRLTFAEDLEAMATLSCILERVDAAWRIVHVAESARALLPVFFEEGGTENACNCVGC